MYRVRENPILCRIFYVNISLFWNYILGIRTLSDVAKVLFTITTTLSPGLILSFYIYSNLYRERNNIYLNLNVKDSIKAGDEVTITTYSLRPRSTQTFCSTTKEHDSLLPISQTPTIGFCFVYVFWHIQQISTKSDWLIFYWRQALKKIAPKVEKFELSSAHTSSWSNA